MTNWTANDAFDDFQVRYENTIPAADTDRVTALLADAYALVEAITGVAYPILDVTATPPPIAYEAVPGVIVAVVCNAVRRAYENPLGLGSETIGDYSWRASAGSPGGVYFTSDEKRILRGAAGLSGVGTLTLTTFSPMPAVDPLMGTYWSTAADEDDIE